jgi:lipoate-protein ligase B
MNPESTAGQVEFHGLGQRAVVYVLMQMLRRLGWNDTPMA